MAGIVLLGAAAAFGVISVLWAALGWLLPGGTEVLLIFRGEPDEGTLARVKWIQSLGLLRCTLVAVMTDPSYENGNYNNDVEYCSPEMLLIRLGQECRESDGTGNGDPSGHHWCRGISEL